MKVSEIVGRWEEIGLLEGIPIEEKPILALKFEQLALFLIEHETSYRDGITTTVFPLLYRVFRGSYIDDITIPRKRVKYVNPLNLLEEYNEFMCREGLALISDLNVHPSIDAEAELLALYSDSYINKYAVTQIEPHKYVPTHRLI